MARGKRHSDRSRAQVMAALLAGQGVSEVATQYHLDKSVVSRIKASISTEKLQQVATKKRDNFGELLAEYLRTQLAALIVQNKVFADEEWLKKQPAGELGTLHGIGMDKVVRLMEAAERANALAAEAGATGHPDPEK